MSGSVLDVAEMFRRHRKLVLSFLRNQLVSSGEIEDLAQEVFIRLMKYGHDTEVENEQGYIFRIAANVANEWRERARIRFPHSPEQLEELIDDRPVDAAIVAASMEKEINRALDLLTPRQRQIAVLHLKEHRTYGQIAEQLGITYRIVLRDLTRAYAILRRELVDQVDLSVRRIRGRGRPPKSVAPPVQGRTGISVGIKPR